MRGVWGTGLGVENFSTGFGKNNWPYILFKKRLVRKTICMTGAVNGGTGQALFSCCSSRKAGVMILFNNNIKISKFRELIAIPRDAL